MARKKQDNEKTEQMKKLLKVSYISQTIKKMILDNLENISPPVIDKLILQLINELQSRVETHKKYIKLWQDISVNIRKERTGLLKKKLQEEEDQKIKSLRNKLNI